MASALEIVTQGRRPVVSGEEEWVGRGKGGRGSPGLKYHVSERTQQQQHETHQEAIIKVRNRI